MWTVRAVIMREIMGTYLAVTLLIVINLFMVAGCHGTDKPKLSGGPFYFENAMRKMKADFPVRPVDAITAEEISKYKTYYVAFYDEKGRIISCEKILHGKTHWLSKYIYSSSGYLEKEEYHNPAGEIIMIYYDKNQNVIKKETIDGRK
jgi:hypothetical protein